MGDAHSRCLFLPQPAGVSIYFVAPDHVLSLFFQVSLQSGMNILYWRTTGILVGGKKVKPVLLKNIQIQGKAWV